MHLRLASCLLSLSLLSLVSSGLPAQDSLLDDAGDAYADKMRHWLGRIARVRVPSAYEKNHPDVKAAFRDVARDGNHSTVRILCDQTPAALGVIASEDGFVLTKASEMHGQIECRLYDGRRFPAQMIAADAASDLALLKIAARRLAAVQWSVRSSPQVGGWLISPGLDEVPAAIGVVSVGPRAIPAATAVLGVFVEPSERGLRIERIIPGSSAERAGLRVNDIILTLNGDQVNDRQFFIDRIQGLYPGNHVALAVQRGDADVQVSAVLGDSHSMSLGERANFQNSLGSPLSARRTGFSQVIQHDSGLRPNLCGGPVLDLEGRTVGLNIARAGRVESYALTAAVVVPIYEQLKANALATLQAARRSATVEASHEEPVAPPQPVTTLKPVP